MFCIWFYHFSAFPTPQQIVNSKYIYLNQKQNPYLPNTLPEISKRTFLSHIKELYRSLVELRKHHDTYSNLSKACKNYYTHPVG